RLSAKAHSQSRSSGNCHPRPISILLLSTACKSGRRPQTNVRIFPELSNSGSLPGKAGGSPVTLGVGTARPRIFQSGWGLEVGTSRPHPVHAYALLAGAHDKNHLYKCGTVCDV